jgi:ATP-dependent Zn protease
MDAHRDDRIDIKSACIKDGIEDEIEDEIEDDIDEISDSDKEWGESIKNSGSFIFLAIYYLSMAIIGSYIVYSLVIMGLNNYRIFNLRDISITEIVETLKRCKHTINHIDVDVDNRYILFNFGTIPFIDAEKYYDNCKSILTNEYRTKYDIATTYRPIVDEISKACNNFCYVPDGIINTTCSVEPNDISISMISSPEPVISVGIIIWLIMLPIFIACIFRVCFERISSKAAYKLNSMVDDLNFNVSVSVKTKFSDISGLSEAKDEITKIVDMIRNRKEYKMFGATIPKGLLLSGPPGCGKTLLAKAVAGESGIPFISINAAEFEEKLVGVGPDRIKKMFRKARSLAKEKGAAIVFIDEIDAIGRSRVNSNRSTETLNMILTELDGFDTDLSVMVIAATNIVEKLDPALTRSGRFDHKIHIDSPNKADRVELFKLYLSKIKIMEDSEKIKLLKQTLQKGKLDDMNSRDKSNLVLHQFELNELIVQMSDDLATTSFGMTGADIRNVCNQAAISTHRAGKPFVTRIELSDAIDTIGIGLEKKSRRVTNDDIVIVGYHESGHAMIGLLLKHADTPVKMSIVPRGNGNLGYTIPGSGMAESGIWSREQILSKMMVLLGGRMAEHYKFNKVTTGASDDLKKVRALATQYFSTGISDCYGNMYIDDVNQMSESRKEEFEENVKFLIDNLSNIVLQIIKLHSDKLEFLAINLLDKECIDFCPSLESDICTDLVSGDNYSEDNCGCMDKSKSNRTACKSHMFEKCMNTVIINNKDSIELIENGSDTFSFI